MKKFKSVEEIINQLKPNNPVYCIRKHTINVASKYFQNKFPGKILYAVKTNPHPEVLKTVLQTAILDISTDDGDLEDVFLRLTNN